VSVCMSAKSVPQKKKYLMSGTGWAFVIVIVVGAVLDRSRSDVNRCIVVSIMWRCVFVCLSVW
jgi:hypothetical protein